MALNSFNKDTAPTKSWASRLHLYNKSLMKRLKSLPQVLTSRRKLSYYFILLMLTAGWLIIGAPRSWKFLPHTRNVHAVISNGDGILFYAASANANPQFRTYSEDSNDFSANAGTVSGSQPYFTYIRNSPTKLESVAGYQDGSGNLHVLCYDGFNWSEDWSVAVAPSGTPTTRAFAIAFETSSGDATVAYSTNTTGTNALAYRTLPGSSGCGSANWSSAANFPTGTSVTTGTVQWVKATRDSRSGQDLEAWIWADSNSDLGGAIWDGTQFTNFNQLETSLEVVTAAQDVDDFELQYESLSGDLMVVWANSAGTNGTNGVRYATCTGGTSGCTWSGSLNPNTGTGDDATSLDLAANPLTNEMVFASIGNAGADLQEFYWSGSAWTIHANQDTTCETPGAGMKLVTVGWLTNNGHTDWYLSYDDSSGTGISWYYGSGTAAPTKPTDFTTSPAINDIRERYDTDMNPFNNAELIQTIADSTGKVIAFKLSMDSSGNLSWSNMASAASLGSLPSVPQKGFDFQYWRYIPPVPAAPSLYGDDGGASQVAFNNIVQNSTTPIFRASATSPSTFNRFQLELNTAADFTGTSYTQTFSGTYASDTAYDLQTTGSLGLPATNGVTYYVRIRGSIDGGTFWGNWSSGTWSYTYTSTAGTAKWFQTTNDQFNTGTLSSTVGASADSVSLNAIGMGTQADWTSLYAGTAFPGTYSYTVNSGTDRLLVVGLASDITANATQSATVTYGGVSLVKQVTDETTNDRQHSWLFYLKDNAVMNGSAQNLVVSITGGTASRNYVYAAVYSGVDQTTPITDSKSFNPGTGTGTAVGPFASALTINSGDTAVEMVSLYRSASTAARTVSAWASGWSSSLGPNSGNDGTNSGSAYAATDTTSGTTTSQHTANGAALRSMTAMSLKWDNGTQSSGTVMSPEINYASVIGQASWGTMSFSSNETHGDIKLRIYYSVSSPCDTIVPDTTLAGNSSGFDVAASPINITPLIPVATIYNKICLQATLTASGGTPLLNDWTIDWSSTGPPAPSIDQCLRSCEYYSGGIKQRLYWAN